MLTRVLILGVFLAILFVGLCVLLYPSMSNYINEKNQTRIINIYDNNTTALSAGDYSQYLKQAQEYNAKLAQSGMAVQDAFESGQISTDKSSDYWKLLNLDGSGVMGYLVIGKINVKLPIYHGTDTAVLQDGVGHIQGSSLPVGGENTHAVLSAHTGLPSAEYFTNLDQMKLGDTFEIHVLGEVLTYQVDQILTVLPDQVNALSIIKGGDYVTLVTCTPYGVNSHRLLVRGTRVASTQTTSQSVSTASDQTKTRAASGEPVWFRKIREQATAAVGAVYEKLAAPLVAAVEWCMGRLNIAY